MRNHDASYIDQAYKRYLDAVEQLKRVAHVLDRDFTGRAPTPSELEDLATRRKAKESALRRIVTWPCADFATLRTKAKFINQILLTGETLSGHDQKGLIHSILQMDHP